VSLLVFNSGRTGLQNLYSGIEMMKISQSLFSTWLLLGCILPLSASDDKPWGEASVLNIEYKPSKVLYDLTSGDKKNLASVLDQIGYLYKLYGSDVFESSIVVVIHGDAIPFFAIDRFKQHKAIMQRAQSLTVGTPIEFRMCRAAARLLDYEPSDIHGFVTMVPMADAEIVRLQQDGYAYMH
jgi:intracellular sulfur oxidation DsrE/DsrF family protein